MSESLQIVPGISVRPSGQATIDPTLIGILAVHIRSVFALYGGSVGDDE